MTLFVSTGCQPAPKTPEPIPTTAPMPTPTEKVSIEEMKQDIVVTFDGEECIYDGPGAVSEGERVITIKNISDYNPQLVVRKLDEGKTWQDILDYYGTPGSSPREWLPEVSDVIKDKTLVQVNPDAWKYQLEEGLYGIFCQSWISSWPAAPLEVKGN